MTDLPPSDEHRTQRGRLTIPSEEGFAAETSRLAGLWGADAVRNSDGTALDQDVRDLGLRVYGAYFPVRGDNDFIATRPEQRPQMFLLSDRVSGPAGPLRIAYAADYFDQQLEPNLDDDSVRLWEVVDRTTGTLVPAERWSVDGPEVVVDAAEAWHEYTVSFLAYVVWDPVEMYNHLTNGWGDKEHEVPYDVRHPDVARHVRAEMGRWLQANSDVDVVRFTTFFYQFSLVFDAQGREKFVDWFGYGATVSPRALAEFEAENGYALRAEDFVDEGYYNSTFRVPSTRYRDWMDFVGLTVRRTAADLVQQVRAAGRESIMFLGDQWIGVEPYGPGFEEIGLDAVVGSVGDGTTLRMIADIPHLRYTEGRFLPYFFPDTFYEGNDPADEAVDNWLQARRAILRKPIDRMGYGGYLSLAARAPRFVSAVAEIAEEFRELHRRIDGTAPRSTLTVALLNAWGATRSWQAFTVAHALHSKQAYSYYGVLEALSGMAVDVRFLSFAEVEAGGVPDDVDVVISAGGAGTAFSGGDWWLRPELVATLRGWVARGGGLLGVGEPGAVAHQGRYFQLADVLGVDRERGTSQSSDKHHDEVTKEHPVIAGIDVGTLDFGESVGDVYALGPATTILERSAEEVHLAANAFHAGRAVYVAGLPFGATNVRLLSQALHWAAGRESTLRRWVSSNHHCEIHVYPEAGVFCLSNNTREPQTTEVVDGEGRRLRFDVAPAALRWEDM